MRNPHIHLWAEDEVHFQRHTTLTRMWAPKGHQPRVISASTRQKIGFFGALDLKTGRLLTKEAVTFNADTFGSFVSFLINETKGKIFMIMDNASVLSQQYLYKVFRFSPRLNLRSQST